MVLARARKIRTRLQQTQSEYIDRAELAAELRDKADYLRRLFALIPARVAPRLVGLDARGVDAAWESFIRPMLAAVSENREPFPDAPIQ